jgi:hypothetical protein
MIGWLIFSVASTIGFWYWYRRRIVRGLGVLLVSGYTRQILLACDALDRAAAEHRRRRKDLGKLVDSVNASSPRAIQGVIEEIERRVPRRLGNVRRGILDSGGELLMIKLYREKIGEPMDPLVAALAFVVMGSEIDIMRVSDRSAMLKAVEEMAQPEHLETVRKLIALSESEGPGAGGDVRH